MKVNALPSFGRIDLALAILEGPWPDVDAYGVASKDWTGEVVWTGLSEAEKVLRALEVVIAAAEDLQTRVRDLPSGGPSEQHAVATAFEVAIQLIRQAGDRFSRQHGLVIPSR